MKITSLGKFWKAKNKLVFGIFENPKKMVFGIFEKPNKIVFGMRKSQIRGSLECEKAKNGRDAIEGAQAPFDPPGTGAFRAREKRATFFTLRFRQRRLKRSFGSGVMECDMALHANFGESAIFDCSFIFTWRKEVPFSRFSPKWELGLGLWFF